MRKFWKSFGQKGDMKQLVFKDHTGYYVENRLKKGKGKNEGDELRGSCNNSGKR